MLELNENVVKEYALVSKGVVYEVVDKEAAKNHKKVDNNCVVKITEDNVEKIEVIIKDKDDNEITKTYYLDTLIKDGDNYEAETFSPNEYHYKDCNDNAIISYVGIHRNDALNELVNSIVEGTSDEEVAQQNFCNTLNKLPIYFKYTSGDEIMDDPNYPDYKEVVSVSPSGLSISYESDEIAECVLHLAAEKAAECANEIASKIGYELTHADFDKIVDGD